MKPFVDSGSIKVYNNDCNKALSVVGHEGADLVFADPPFNVGKKYERGERAFKSDEDYYGWCARWISDAWVMLRPGGSFWLMTIQRHLGEMWKQLARRGTYRKLIVWKNSSMPIRDNFCTAFQPILYFSKPGGDPVFNYGFERKMTPVKLTYGRQTRDGAITDIWDDIPFLSGGCISSRETIFLPGTNKKAHDCQMPVALARRAVGHTTNTGETVVDMFCGSGTVPEACWLLGRNCIAFEKDSEYVGLISERMSRLVGQDSLLSV